MCQWHRNRVSRLRSGPLDPEDSTQVLHTLSIRPFSFDEPYTHHLTFGKHGPILLSDTNPPILAEWTIVHSIHSPPK